MADIRSVARRHLLAEIARIVAEARSADEIVRAGYHAGRLLRIYPTAGFSLGRIIDEIIVAATAAGLAVEMSRPEQQAAASAKITDMPA